MKINIRDTLRGSLLFEESLGVHRVDPANKTDSIILKNPTFEEVKNLPPAARGIITQNGDLYMARTSYGVLHGTLAKFLRTKGWLKTDGDYLDAVNKGEILTVHYISKKIKFSYSVSPEKWSEVADPEQVKALIKRYEAKNEIPMDLVYYDNTDREDFEKFFGIQKPVLYSAVVLTDGSMRTLYKQTEQYLEEGWTPIMHHMTIGFKKSLHELGLDKDEGMQVPLRITHFGKSDKAMAVMVSGYKSLNDIPHITVAVNDKAGGKPYMSNQITDWQELERPFNIIGIVENVYA